MKTQNDLANDPLAFNIRQNARITSAGPKRSPATKTCSGPCGKELPLTDFGFGENPNFRRGMCLECEQEITRRRAAQKPIRGVAQQVQTLDIKREY